MIEPSEHVDEIDSFSGYKIGVIVDNNDPLKLSRVRVEIPEWRGIPTAHIPWACLLQPIELGGSSTLSSHIIPEVGTSVLLTFVNRNTPIVMGVLKDATTHQPKYDKNYPDSYGKEDPNGFTTFTDKVTKTATIVHTTGLSISIDSNKGDITVDMPDNFTWNVVGNIVATITGNTTINTPNCFVESPHIELGTSAVQSVIRGDDFVTWWNATWKTEYDNHTHIGNLGYPTLGPSATTPLSVDPQSTLSSNTYTV